MSVARKLRDERARARGRAKHPAFREKDETVKIRATPPRDLSPSTWLKLRDEVLVGDVVVEVSESILCPGPDVELSQWCVSVWRVTNATGGRLLVRALPALDDREEALAEARRELAELAIAEEAGS